MGKNMAWTLVSRSEYWTCNFGDRAQARIEPSTKILRKSRETEPSHGSCYFPRVTLTLVNRGNAMITVASPPKVSMSVGVAQHPQNFFHVGLVFEFIGIDLLAHFDGCAPGEHPAQRQRHPSLAEPILQDLEWWTLR